MSSNNEQDIINACKNGESWAYKVIYEKYAPAMLSICVRYLGQKSLAEDVLQEGFIRLFENIHQYKGKGYFSGWVKRIFVNASLTEINRNKQQRKIISLDDFEIKQIEDSNIVLPNEELKSDDIHKMVTELPEKYRIVFNLIGVEEYSYKEAAEELNMNESTLRTLFHRARKFLQEKISEQLKIRDEQRGK